MKQIVIFYPTLAKVTNYVSFCSKIPTIMLPKTDDDILNSKQQKIIFWKIVAFVFYNRAFPEVFGICFICLAFTIYLQVIIQFFPNKDKKVY